jgi:hypothetical protein
VRTFKDKRWALRELKRRKLRRQELAAARGEAEATGERVEVRHRGRATLTVWFDPTRKKAA